MIGKEQIIEIYRRRASNYDWTANLYYLLGYREYHYRKLAVRRLDLSRGDAVLELGCGTGLNLAYLREKIGPEGRITALDMTDAMLERARDRSRKSSWENVQFVQGDMTRFKYPAPLDGIISTFALSLAPDIEKVIRRSYEALRKGGSLVVLDLREPSNWLSILRPLILPVERPFGVTRELVDAQPWKEVEAAFFETFENSKITPLFAGFSFLAWGRKQ